MIPENIEYLTLYYGKIFSIGKLCDFYNNCLYPLIFQQIFQNQSLDNRLLQGIFLFVFLGDKIS